LTVTAKLRKRIVSGKKKGAKVALRFQGRRLTRLRLKQHFQRVVIIAQRE